LAQARRVFPDVEIDSAFGIFVKTSRRDVETVTTEKKKGGGLAVSAQGITPVLLSMASRVARSRPCGPATPIDRCAAACGALRWPPAGRGAPSGAPQEPHACAAPDPASAPSRDHCPA